MSRFTKSISVFMAGIALLGTKSQASQEESDNPFVDTLDPISLRPLNQAGDNLYAAHRSHSSHSSHSSHRSSSSTYSSPSRSYSAPRRSYSAPDSSYPRSQNSNSLYNSSTGSSQSVDPGRPAVVTPTDRDINPADAKLMELIKRVQLGLLIKGYSPGAVDGVMGARTRAAIKLFQRDYGLNPDGLMGTETLNALGVVVPR